MGNQNQLQELTKRIQDFIAARGKEMTPFEISVLTKLEGPEAVAMAQYSKNEFLRAQFTDSNTDELLREMMETVEQNTGMSFRNADGSYSIEGITAYNYLLQNLMTTEKVIPRLPWFDRMGMDDRSLAIAAGEGEWQSLFKFLDLSMEDKELEVERWPTAVTKSQKVRTILRQAKQAGLIDDAGRLAKTQEGIDFFNNLMQNWDQWTSDIDEISTENERNYENVVDRLFNYALQEPRTPTEIEQKTAYGGWTQLTSPTMQPPREWSDAYTVATEMGEEAEDFIKKYTTDAITTFKNEVNQKYPDALLNTEQKAEKQRFIAEQELRIQENLDRSQGIGLASHTIALGNQRLIPEIMSGLNNRLEVTGAIAEREKQYEIAKDTSTATTAIKNAVQGMDGPGMGHGLLPSTETLNSLGTNYYQYVQGQKQQQAFAMTPEQYIDAIGRENVIDSVNQKRVDDYKNTDAFTELMRGMVGLPERPEVDGGGEFGAVQDFADVFESQLRAVPGSIDNQKDALEATMLSFQGQGITPMGDFAPFSGMRMDKFGQPIYESGPEFLQNLSLYPWQVQEMVNYAQNRPPSDIVAERFGAAGPPSPPSNIFGQKETRYFTSGGETPMHVVGGQLVPDMSKVRSVQLPSGPFKVSTPYLPSTEVLRPEPPPPPNITTEPYFNLGFNPIASSVQEPQAEFDPYPQSNIFGINNYDPDQYGKFSPYTRPWQGSGYSGGTFRT